MRRFLTVCLVGAVVGAFFAAGFIMGQTDPRGELLFNGDKLRGIWLNNLHIPNSRVAFSIWSEDNPTRKYKADGFFDENQEAIFLLIQRAHQYIQDNPGILPE